MSNHSDSSDIGLIVACVVLVLGLGIGGAFAYPVYSVWSQGKAGQAELARAESNRKIAVEEARAKVESAKLLADADIIRAEGEAKANAIIGASLKDNEARLRYLWIQSLSETKDQIIYVPTEAGLPLLEAGRTPR